MTTARWKSYVGLQACFGGGTAPLEQISLSSGTASYIVANLVGVGGVTSTTGSIIATKSYSPYGTVSGSSSSTPFGYEGSYTDPNGLVYMIHRYYDPSTAQFLSVDPLVNATHTPYSYANDDPFDVTDPSGLCGCAGVAMVLGLLAGIAGTGLMGSAGGLLASADILGVSELLPGGFLINLVIAGLIVGTALAIASASTAIGCAIYGTSSSS